MTRLFLALLSCLSILNGCVDKPEEPRAPASGHIKTREFPRDDLNREIKLSAPAKRVVCIGPGATETIFALGAGEKLVGRDQVSDYPKEALKLPVAGDFTGPFVEKVVALRPDLVIVQGETYDKTRAENWQQKIGVPVAVLVPLTVDEIEQGMQKISVWLNVKKELPISIYPRTGHRIGVSAFFEVQRSPLWTAGQGTLIADVLRISGLDNIAQVRGYKQFNAEQLLTLQPHAYVVPVTAQTKSDEYPRLWRELKAHRVLGRLECVRRKRVIFINSDWVLRPGPRLRKGLQELARRADAMAIQEDKARR